MVVPEEIVKNARVREKDGVPYVSTTSVLQLAPFDPRMEQYKAMIGIEAFLKILNEAALRGTMAHEYLEDHFRGIVRSYNAEAFVSPDDSIDKRVKNIKRIQGFFDAANNFIAHDSGHMVVELENIEKELFMDIDCYGTMRKLSGRLDLIPTKFRSHGMTIMDFKTKTNLNIHQFERDKWGMQLALYGFGSGLPIEHGAIVALTETGRFEVFDYELDELKEYYRKSKMYVAQFYNIVEELKLPLIKNV